jgi:quercetin dioxygenase-like cupin family protein
MNDESGHNYLKSHQLSGDVLNLDLDDEQKQILQGAKASGTGNTAKTLIKEGALRVVMVGLKQGASLREHRAEGPVAIQTLQGAVRISSPGGSEALPVGSMLVFGGGISHSVEAESDSVLLVTLALGADSH